MTQAEQGTRTIRQRLNFGVCVALLLAGTHCATVVDGSHQQVHFRVTPPNARMTVDGSDTPIGPERVVTLARDKQHRVEVTFRGCKDRAFYIEYGGNGTMWWNLFIPPWFISFGLDFMTGAFAELRVPDGGFTINLDCEQGSETARQVVAENKSVAPTISATSDSKPTSKYSGSRVAILAADDTLAEARETAKYYDFVVVDQLRTADYILVLLWTEEQNPFPDEFDSYVELVSAVQDHHVPSAGWAHRYLFKIRDDLRLTKDAHDSRGR